MSDKEETILKDVEESGYPLEVDVANWLIEKGWSPIPQYVYTDEKTKKMRTIDFVAYYFTKSISDVANFPQLVIECKTTRREKQGAWVFHFTINPVEGLKEVVRSLSLVQNQTEMRGIGIDLFTFVSMSGTFASLIQQHLDLENLEKSYASLTSDKVFDLIFKSHFFDANLPRAYSCHVVRQKDEDSPNIFRKAVYQVKGACTYLAKSYPKWPIMATIVYNGDLYGYKRGLKPELTPYKHVLYSTPELIPEDLTFPQNSMPPFVIDVVKDTYFTEYLELLKKDFEILNTVRRKLERIGNE
jgi:hypothetical protein